jgi:hypothetical protein
VIYNITSRLSQTASRRMQVKNFRDLEVMPTMDVVVNGWVLWLVSQRGMQKSLSRFLLSGKEALIQVYISDILH